jgi:hypothetical protein
MGGGAALAGAAGARGAGGAGGMPMGGGMGGAGGGGKGEDKEHRVAAYLKGDEDLLAPGKVVSPPVIGDWNNEQDWK